LDGYGKVRAKGNGNGKATAGPSTALRFAQDDTFFGLIPKTNSREFFRSL
jgi:hypothetical protein